MVAIRARARKWPQRRAMTALGHKRTCAAQNGMSALPPKAMSNATYGSVRFGHTQTLLRYGGSENDDFDPL